MEQMDKWMQTRMDEGRFDSTPQLERQMPCYSPLCDSIRLNLKIHKFNVCFPCDRSNS